jgi:chemotaxis protein MotB
MSNQPIIIKKVKKGGGHGHHGGAWKLAYADFVTAMMAFFLLMWLLGSTTKETRQGIADYFHDPFKASLSGGDSVGDRTSIIQGGGTDVTSQDSGQVDRGQEPKTEEMPPVMQELTDDQLQEQSKAAEAVEAAQLEKLKEEIQEKVNENKELNEFKEQIKLETTPEGLRVVIVDTQNRPMFNLASASAAPYIQVILKNLTPLINSLPNKISINGHTDSLPFPPNQTGYSNWELSSDRANTARHELIKAGLTEDKVLRVVGLASSVPYNPDDTTDPMNRRILIVVMNKKTEEQILAGAGGEKKAVEGAESEPQVNPINTEINPITSPTTGH